MLYINASELLCRMLFSALIGAVFGTERMHRNKPIGARTHILVSVAACSIALISAYGFVEVSSAYPPNMSVRTDPARLMVGMLTGIGFIGAGIIYKSPHGDIKGITTAAEIYLMAVLGIGAGLGLYELTGIAAVIAYVTLICSEARIIMFREKINRYTFGQFKKIFHRRTHRTNDTPEDSKEDERS
ncbi:MAG: MgtC/SapB family protein [Cloacibacillus sp.]